MAEMVEFEPNTPVQLALKYQGEGRTVQGRFGDQKYFTLADGRCMYLDLPVAEQIEAYRFRPGEPFWIEKKWSGKKAERPRWEVWPVQQNGTGIAETPLEADLRRSLEQCRAAGSRPATPAATAPLSKPARPTSNGNSSTSGHANGNGHASFEAPPSSSSKTPLNVAVIEAVQMVQHAMKVTGEQWDDQAKQDLVSTLLITYQREGWLTLPEREAA